MGRLYRTQLSVATVITLAHDGKSPVGGNSRPKATVLFPTSQVGGTSVAHVEFTPLSRGDAMRWRGFLYVLYVFSVLAGGIYVLIDLFSTLEIDLWRQLAVMIALIVVAEWFAVIFPQGMLSGGFAVILATFLIFGGPEMVYVAGFSALIGQGIANRGNPLRTTLFNAAQYILAARGALWLYTFAGGTETQSVVANLLPLLLFVVGYYLINHLLTYLYQLPRLQLYPSVTLGDVLRWDALTYLFTVPIGVLIFLIYGSNGMLGVVLLFVPVIILQYVLRLYVDLELVNRELSTLYNISSRLANTDLDQLLALVLKELRRVASYHTGIFYLWRHEKGYFDPVVIESRYAKELRKMYVYPGEGFVGRVASEMDPLLVGDTRRDKLLSQEPGLPKVMRSLLAIPLISASGVVGVIVLGSKQQNAFDDHHLHIVTMIGGQVAMAIQNAILSNRLRLFFER